MNKKEKHRDARTTIPLRKGLGRMLLLWFLFPTLIPLSFLIVLSRYLELDGVQWSGIIVMVCAMIFSVAVLAFATSKKIVMPLLRLSKAADRVAAGDLDHAIDIQSHNELGELADHFNAMVATLKRNRERDERKAWMENGYAALSERLRGGQKLDAICHAVISFLSTYLDAQIGAVYLCDKEGVLKTAAGYALPKDREDLHEFAPGEGLVGEAAREKKTIHLENVPDRYARITSAVGEAPPKEILIAPILSTDTPRREEADVMGVVELGSLVGFTREHRMFLEQVMEMISIAVSAAKRRNHVIELLREREDQAQALLYQQDMLRDINLKLEKRTRVLQAQHDEIETANAALKKAQLEIVRKARDLEIASCYKTEFLANMSHELRTPLNSLLILSQVLSENKEGNLTPRQIKGIGMIRDAGKDLLGLIDEILDLSNVQAGKLQLSLEEIRIRELAEFQERSFGEAAKQKGIHFHVEVSENLPDSIRSDRHRLEQMLRNLLSNALKFTDEGGFVEVRFETVGASEVPAPYEGDMIAISVRDTGIGIAPDKQETIFDTFTQVDGTRSRKYGGTGLGLTIVKRFAELMGGSLILESAEDEGSTFSILLPLVCREIEGAVMPADQAFLDPVDPRAALYLSMPDEDEPIVEREPGVERPFPEPSPSQQEKKKRSPKKDGKARVERIACLEGKRVLVVDDDMRTVFKLSNMLEKQGMLVSIGRNRPEAMERLDEHPDIELVLADLNVLQEEGLNAVGSVAPGSSLGKRVLIVLTDDDKIEGSVNRVSGVNGFITRPIKERKLLSFLESRMETDAVKP